ncbi:MAG: glycoside hydrolase, partial [Candidatus Mariimomonas ferrooxydans]
LVDEEAAYVFAYSSKEGGKRYMVFRKTDDRGKSWSEPLEIKEIGSVTLFIEPVRIGKRLHVFWFNGYDDFQIVEGAYSDDGGNTWITKTFEDTKGFDLGTLRVAHDRKGHIYLAVYGHWKDNEKNNVYIIRSEDNGTTWQDMTPLRRYSSQLTQAKKPDIMATEGGEVVAVWVDFRNIRRNLYMQYSKDFGRTWQEKDIPLEEPGKFNTGHFVYTDSLIKVKDVYYVLAYRFRGDLVTIGEADLLLLDFKLDAKGAR